MEKIIFEAADEFTDLVRSLSGISREISRLEELVAEMTGKPAGKRIVPDYCSAAPSPETPAARKSNPPSGAGIPEFDADPGRGSNVIPFPARGAFTRRAPEPRKAPSRREAVPLPASPGKTLPPHITDYRPFLQRDGLILLAWDRRATEMGDRYTAYWVTSAGTPRFYASKPLSLEEFVSARPHHKSYAAEDGIEFYGLDAPSCLVHVAPELMMSNPAHGSLRELHIEVLKKQGIDVDFSYKYLLTAEKKKNPLLRPANAGRERRRLIRIAEIFAGGVP